MMSEQWPVIPLGELCQIKTGRKDANQGSPNGKYPFFTCAKEHIWSDEYSFEGEALLIAGNGDVGNTTYYDGKFEAYQRTYVLMDFKGVSANFLFYALSDRLKAALVDKKLGSTMPYIKKGMLSNFPIIVPPMEEQQRIVRILDEVFESITVSVDQLKNSLFQNNELYEQMLNQIFENSNEEWVEKTLDNICTVKRGSSPRPIKSYFTEDPNGVSWIKIGDTKGVDKYITKTKQKITKEGAERSRLVNKGDLILSNSMSYGKPFIMGISGYIHDGWFVLYVNKEVDSEFLFYALSSRLVQSQFSNLAAGSVVKNISGDLVKKAVIPIPPLSEQKQIVEDIKSMIPSIKSLTSISNAKLESLGELKRSILQEAFNGNLTKEINA